MESITQKHRDYWSKTVRLTGILLAVWFVSTFVMAWFARELAEFKIFGWPFSFYMAAQGSLIIYVVIIGLYAKWMGNIDHEFGVAEEEED